MAPQLLDGLKNTRVQRHEKITLSCRISRGVDTADVQWYRTGKCCKIFRKIFDDEKYRITSDDDTMSLTIAECEESDSATYRCEVVNKFGKVRTECIVVVLRMCHLLSTLLITSNVIYFILW